MAVLRGARPELANARFAELWARRSGWAAGAHAWRDLEALLRGLRGEAAKSLLVQSEGRTLRLRREGLGARRFLISLEDATFRSALTGELGRARELREEAERLRVTTRLVSAIAHDLAATLRAFSMQLHLAETTRMPAELIGALRAGIDSAMRGVRQLLDVGQDELARPVPVRAAAVVRDAIRIVQNERPAAAPAVRFQMRAPSGLPDAWCPPPALLSILLTLLRNAIEAMPRGGTIRIRCRSKGGKLIVAVHDEGEGLAPAVSARLFEPFFSTKNRTGGHGVGLWLARTSAQRMGGTLAAGRVRRGACFVLELPLAVPERAARGGRRALGRKQRTKRAPRPAPGAAPAPRKKLRAPRSGAPKSRG